MPSIEKSKTCAYLTNNIKTKDFMKDVKKDSKDAVKLLRKVVRKIVKGKKLENKLENYIIFNFKKNSPKISSKLLLEASVCAYLSNNRISSKELMEDFEKNPEHAIKVLRNVVRKALLNKPKI